MGDWREPRACGKLSCHVCGPATLQVHVLSLSLSLSLKKEKAILGPNLASLNKKSLSQLVLHYQLSLIQTKLTMYPACFAIDGKCNNIIKIYYAKNNNCTTTSWHNLSLHNYKPGLARLPLSAKTRLDLRPRYPPSLHNHPLSSTLYHPAAWLPLSAQTRLDLRTRYPLSLHNHLLSSTLYYPVDSLPRTCTTTC